MKEWTEKELYRILNNPDEISEMHEKVVNSEYRQSYHIQPITGLLNDPNGFIFRNGIWHLFYQWCPWGAVHGMKHWYHVVSEDLVNWKNMGLAIRPDTEYDNKGVFSGSAIEISDAVYLFYTGNHIDDDGTRIPYTCAAEFKNDGQISKLSEPIFAPSSDFTDNQRDPKIIYNEKFDKYYLIIGARSFDEKGVCLVYQSESLLADWKFAGRLKVTGYEDFGGMWECPSIERICGRDVLFFCPQYLKLEGRGNVTNHNIYIIGEMNWENLTFTPIGDFNVFDFGFDFYAAQCAANIKNDDKAFLMAWMGLPASVYPTDVDEWSGCLSLPRELTIHKDRLIQKPIEQLESLRSKEISADEIMDGHEKFAGAIEMSVDVAGGDFEIKLFTDLSGKGGLSIKYNDKFKKITADKSGLKRRFNTDFGEVREHFIENTLLHLGIFIDTSSVEIFVNGGEAVFTSRVFPTDDEVSFTITPNGTVKLWRLKEISDNTFVV
ncbi:MAG: sucrose-6-phosphate hydrolase [Lachnospiraceae bacterium]|nr:sucrose-6-phosphate hydrolase [Lachnospiraceae bacterium]